MRATNPFLYPEKKHERVFSPGPFSNYRSYKRFLRSEFGGQCVYCRLPDANMTSKAFAVEHYRPKRRFPADRTAYSNLFYACAACNSYKGRFWPSKIQLKSGHFVVNPCDHIMTQHVRYKGSRVTSATISGRFMIDLLKINDDASIEYRARYQRQINNTKARLIIERDRLRFLERKMSSAAAPTITVAVLARKRRLVADLERDIVHLMSKNIPAP